MGCNCPTATTRRVYDHFDFLLGECRRGFSARSPSVIRIDLDPVGAMADLIANDADDIVAVCFFGALRNFPLGREAFRTVTARSHDGARRREHSGSRYDSLLYSLLHSDTRT